MKAIIQQHQQCIVISFLMLIKITFFLVVIPCFLSQWHITHRLKRENIVRITLDIALKQEETLDSRSNANDVNDEVHGFNGFDGFYRPISPRSYQKVLMHPVVPFITVRVLSDTDGSNSNKQVSFQETTKQWCLIQPNTVQQLCSEPMELTDRQIPPLPASSIWSLSSSGDLETTTTTVTESEQFVVRNYYYNNNNHKRTNRNLEFILNQPTTVLLLTLLVALAFCYWNYRIDPSLVSKSFTTIVQQDEWYRAFTGATAHFEPLHLGFNSMALYGLGEQLEGIPPMDSISFLFYNIALVPITTILMMSMTFIRIKQHTRSSSSNNNNNNTATSAALGEQSAVGYSGVLFAWMVVSSLNSTEQDVCPIPVFTDVCFHTYTLFHGYRFNAGPLVQLVVLQILLNKKVSFVGHLAGIVAGFCLHWNLLPLNIIQPCIFIPLLYVVLLFLRHNPRQQHQEMNMLTDTTIVPTGGKQQPWLSQNASRLFILLLTYLDIFHVGVVHWTMIASIFLEFILLSWHANSNTNSTSTTADKSSSMTTAIMITSILILMTDSMTLGGWWVTTIVIPRILWWYMMLRIFCQITILCTNSSNNMDSYDVVVKTIFGWTVLKPANQIRQNFLGGLLQLGKKAPTTAGTPKSVAGRGHVLGGRGQQEHNGGSSMV